MYTCVVWCQYSTTKDCMSIVDKSIWCLYIAHKITQRQMQHWHIGVHILFIKISWLGCFAQAHKSCPNVHVIASQSSLVKYQSREIHFLLHFEHNVIYMYKKCQDSYLCKVDRAPPHVIRCHLSMSLTPPGHCLVISQWSNCTIQYSKS